MSDPNHLAFRIMSPFEIYLRTGRRVKSMAEIEQISLKFNPWHDPNDGRFTYSGAGSSSGGNHRQSSSGASRTRQLPPQTPSHPRDAFRNGGGSAGGGGATGTWNTSFPQAAQTTTIPERNAAVIAAALRSKPLGLRTPVVQNPPPVQHSFESNGYRFDIDTIDRTQSVSGLLKLDNSQSRSRQAQSRAGGLHRKPSDEGGHYVALRFGGPPIPENHFAQDRNFNRGAYRVIEDKWAKALALGHRVSVKIVPAYKGPSARPEEIVVQWKIDGNYNHKIFPNTFGGK